MHAVPAAVAPAAMQMGFFAEAGPLQVFVSNHLIPEDFEFNTAHEPCYISSDGEQKIVPGSEVRLRIVGTRVDAHEIVSAAAAAAACVGPRSALCWGRIGGWGHVLHLLHTCPGMC
jgi:DNA-directed RNA polymerase subunit E'/Rpb7